MFLLKLVFVICFFYYDINNNNNNINPAAFNSIKLHHYLYIYIIYTYNLCLNKHCIVNYNIHVMFVVFFNFIFYTL